MYFEPFDKTQEDRVQTGLLLQNHQFSEMAKLQVAFWLLVAFTVMLKVEGGDIYRRMGFFGELRILTEHITFLF